MKNLFLLILLLSCFKLLKAQINPIEPTRHNQWPYTLQLNDTAAIQKAFVGYRYLLEKVESLDSTIAFLEYLHAASKQLNYSYGMARSNMALSNSLMYSGKYDMAIEKAKETITLCLSNGAKLKRLLPQLYYVVGTSYSFLGYKQMATAYFFEALKAIEQYTQTYCSPASVYINLADALPDKEKAISYLMRAYEVATTRQEVDLRVISLQNAAVVYNERKNIKQSDSLLAIARTILADSANNKLLYNAYMREAFIYNNRKDYLSALKVLENASLLVDTAPISVSQKNNLIVLSGIVQLNLKHYDSAGHLFHQALNVAVNKGLKSQEVSIYRELYKLFKEEANVDSAIFYLEKHERLTTDMDQARVDQAIGAMEIEFGTKEKDKQLLAQKHRLETRNYLIIAAVILLCVAIILILIVLRISKLKQYNIKKSMEIDLLKAVMKGEENERSRIADALHDDLMVNFSVVKMNLSALEHKASKGSDKVALQGLIGNMEYATSELRKAAHNLMPELLLKEGLEGALRYFCANLNTSTKIQLISQGVLPPMARENLLLLYRTAQELIQNAIKYAEASIVLIQIDALSDPLSITVEDNGRGFVSKDLGVKENNSMGLHKIRSRILSLNGNFNITSAPDEGTSVYLEIPLDQLK